MKTYLRIEAIRAKDDSTTEIIELIIAFHFANIQFLTNVTLENNVFYRHVRSHTRKHNVEQTLEFVTLGEKASTGGSWIMIDRANEL